MSQTAASGWVTTEVAVAADDLETRVRVTVEGREAVADVVAGTATLRMGDGSAAPGRRSWSTPSS